MLKAFCSRARKKHSPSDAAAYAAVLILCLVGQGCLFAGDWPDILKIAVEEAEENFFDGDYEEALRKIDDAQAWLAKPANQKALASGGEDHGLCSVLLAGLEADVRSEIGEFDAARRALKRALNLLHGRRAYLTKKRGLVIPNLWKYEAFLSFIEGDLHRSVAVFDLASDDTVPEKLRKLLEDRGNANRSVSAYRQADGILSRPPASNDNDLIFKRLRGRLLVGLAHGAIYKSGYPSKNDVKDASDYLDRAEELFRMNPFWESFIASDADVPIKYKELEGKMQQRGAGAVVSLKRAFHQAIRDWLSLKLKRVELSVAVERSGEGIRPGMITAEKGYAAILGFCRAHFPHDHPSCRSVMMSRARWYTYLAHSMTRVEDDAKKREQLSIFRDAIFEVQKVRLCKNVGRAVKEECDVLELNALLEIRRMALVGLDDGQRAKDEQRVKDLQQRLANENPEKEFAKEDETE